MTCLACIHRPLCVVFFGVETLVHDTRGPAFVIKSTLYLEGPATIDIATRGVKGRASTHGVLADVYDALGKCCTCYQTEGNDGES